jgi:hypothetical protein
MAKKKRPPSRQVGKLLAMDMATEIERELVGTTEAAQILGIGVGYLRQLARDEEIWSDTRFGKRCPVYDAVELRNLAERMQAERAAGKRGGRPPSGGPKRPS